MWRIIVPINKLKERYEKMNQPVWNIPPAVPIPEELLRAGYSPLLAAVLASRGIATAADASDFLNESGALEDPFRLTDMEIAVGRIRRAQREGERVAVYGDYDVDGITAACLLTEYLRSIELDTEIYIPDRLEEGYGLNNSAIETLHRKNVKLIISVDCGVTAVEETDYAASLGVDMIITDHHECQAELPRAAAVVNPKRPDSHYRNRDLAGVGVAFKLVCALSGAPEDALERFADLVAVGTVADVMPLTGENRAITKIGLDKLRQSPRPGLAALMNEAGVHGSRLSAMTIGFTLAPRINAAGRLGRVSHAAELMLEQDPDRAARLAAELCDMNRERQQLEAEIWAQARKMLEGQTPDSPIVLAGEGWHQGVIGIAASRLAEAYSVPAIMISLDGDRGKGSCRSYGGFNLFDALSACGDLLEAFGGHALAAGLNIARENVDAFRQALAAYYKAHPPTEAEGLSPDVRIDSPDLLTMDCVESLDLLEPCGAGNPRPTFCMTDARLVSLQPIGGGRHTSLRLEKFGHVYSCVWFSQRAADIGLRPGDRTDVIFYPQISEYHGRSVQLLMQAMRRSDVSRLCRDVLTGDEGKSRSLRLDREELGRIWRSLDRRCPLHMGFDDLGQIEPRLSPAKIALGLRVLKELSLARLSFDGNQLDITLVAPHGKADLMESAAWRLHHG